jgi:hypothetical protein
VINLKNSSHYLAPYGQLFFGKEIAKPILYRIKTAHFNVEERIMTRSHRIIAASLISILLLTGFVVGRISKSSNTSVAAETAPAVAANSASAQPVAENANTNDQFYLSDFKTGYNDGYQAGLTKQTGVATVETTRQGYNEGYKEGYTDAYKSEEPETATAARPAVARERVVYRTVNRSSYVSSGRRGGSKLRKILTIAAPAAVGAGIGAAFGGKKGAGIGALLGGGGGAFYLLSKRGRR